MTRSFSTRSRARCSTGSSPSRKVARATAAERAARNPATARVAWWPVVLAVALAGCTSTGGGSPPSRSHLDAVATLDGHLLSPQGGVLLIEGDHYAVTLQVRSESDVDRLTVALAPPGGRSGEVTACPTATCVELLSDRSVSSGQDLATRWLVPGG